MAKRGETSPPDLGGGDGDGDEDDNGDGDEDERNGGDGDGGGLNDISVSSSELELPRLLPQSTTFLIDKREMAVQVFNSSRASAQ